MFRWPLYAAIAALIFHTHALAQVNSTDATTEEMSSGMSDKEIEGANKIRGEAQFSGAANQLSLDRKWKCLKAVEAGQTVGKECGTAAVYKQVEALIPMASNLLSLMGMKADKDVGGKGLKIGCSLIPDLGDIAAMRIIEDKEAPEIIAKAISRAIPKIMAGSAIGNIAALSGGALGGISNNLGKRPQEAAPSRDEANQPAVEDEKKLKQMEGVATQMKHLAEMREVQVKAQKGDTLRAVTWGASSACYVVDILKFKPGSGGINKNSLIKAIASAGLSTFYGLKAEKYHRYFKSMYSDMLNEMAGFNGKRCNPYLPDEEARRCFCMSPLAKQLNPEAWNDKCYAKFASGERVPDQIQLPCINNKLERDDACQCRGEKTCFSDRFAAMAQKLGITGNTMSNIQRVADLVSQGGSISEGKLNSLAKMWGARARAGAKKLTTQTSLPTINLGPKRKAFLDDALALGIPKEFGPAVLAKVDLNRAGAMNTSGMTPATLAAIQKSGGDFSSKSSASYGKSDSEDDDFESDDSGFELPSLPGQDGEGANADDSGPEDMVFAQKAIESADVTDRPDVSIFQLLGRRYQTAVSAGRIATPKK